MTGPLNFLVSRRPVYLIYWVTQACNFSCAHCFNHKRNNGPGKDLDLSEIRRVSQNMGHIKYLTLAGGEPLLRKDLPDIASIFCLNNDVHMLNLVTNGWYSETAEKVVTNILQRCPKVHLSVGVSVDGPEHLHDRLRSKPGSYARALETLGRLKKNRQFGRRLTVAACGTYNRDNADYLVNLARHFQENMGIPYYLGLIRGSSVPDMNLMGIEPHHFLHTVSTIGFSINTRLVNRYPFKHARVAVDQVVTNILRESLVDNKAVVNCKAGKKGFVLTSDGDVLLCEILNTVLGNVRDHGFSPYAILDREASKKAMDDIVKTRCHCTWECFQRLNVVFSPSLYPQVLKAMMGAGYR